MITLMHYTENYHGYHGISLVNDKTIAELASEMWEYYYDTNEPPEEPWAGEEWPTDPEEGRLFISKHLMAGDDLKTYEDCCVDVEFLSLDEDMDYPGWNIDG